VIGFANVEGRPTDISGKPQDFFGSNWGLGGMGVVGVRYFFSPSLRGPRNWFVDLRYAISVSAHQTSNYASIFTSQSVGEARSGTLVGNSSGGVTVQGVTIILNLLL
jgi:hypothetical protein